MKIYNVTKIPQGLGYDEVDYEALYHSGYTAGHASGYTDAQTICHTATAISLGVLYCPDEWKYNVEGYPIEPGETKPTNVKASPSTAILDLVYSSSDPTIVSVDAEGNITGQMGKNYQSATITVTDRNTNLSASKEIDVVPEPYNWTLLPNDCPCTDYEGWNDCACVPASGGTYYIPLALHTPFWANTTEVTLIEKPSWVDISPSAATLPCHEWVPIGSGGIPAHTVTVTFEPCTEIASYEGEQRLGPVTYQENGVSGLTGGFYVAQYKQEPPTE